MVHSFSRFRDRTRSIGRFAPGLTLIVVLALAGCASVPPPDGAMSLTQSELQSARDAGAADYAPVDLGFAQNKFQQAQEAMAKRKYADATRLAEEARADAELARAKALLGDARAKIQAKVEENKRLRERMEQAHPELSRHAPDNPATALPALPGAAPVGEMPAPSSSVLAPPPPPAAASSAAGAGFQTIPQQPAASPASTSDANQGGQL